MGYQRVVYRIGIKGVLSVQFLSRKKMHLNLVIKSKIGGVDRARK